MAAAGDAVVTAVVDGATVVVVSIAAGICAGGADEATDVTTAEPRPTTVNARNRSA